MKRTQGYFFLGALTSLGPLPGGEGTREIRPPLLPGEGRGEGGQNAALARMRQSRKRIWVALSLVLFGLGADDQPRNLIPNGDFEAGATTPAGWQTVDGLSSFWVADDDPAHGKVIKFDTDVLQS